MSDHSQPSKIASFVGAAVAMACAALPAEADEFSWQLSGGTSRVEVNDFDSDTWSVDATYFVNPIDDTTGPYALASFLNPTTRLSAEASERDSPFEFTDHPTAYTLRGTYVLPTARWYVGASYAKSNESYTSRFYSQSDPKGYDILAGRYLGPNTTLQLGFGRSERDFESVLPCPTPAPCTPVPLSVETTTDSVGLEVFHVRQFRSLTYSLQGRVSQSDFDEDVSPSTPLFSDGDPWRVYSVAGELYPTDRLGVRIGYSRPDTSFDSETYDLAATWFFKPRIAVQFALGHSKVDDVPAEFGNGESDSAAVRFIGRL